MSIKVDLFYSQLRKLFIYAVEAVFKTNVMNVLDQPGFSAKYVNDHTT